MNISVTIQAPELVGAVNNLAQALGGKGFNIGQALPDHGAIQVEQQAPQQATQAPVQQQPTQQQQPQSVPTSAPAQTEQQTPQQNQQAPQEQPQQGVPTTAPSYDMNQLAVAATQLMDAGKRDDLVGLLNQFGVQALTALPKEQYGAFATKLREMGAKI